jgi:hypothetical protein
MGHSREQIILCLNRLFCVKQGQFAARCVPDLKSPLIKISGTRPETICTRSITGTIDTMTPDTFGKVDPLSSFDHVRGWFRRKRTSLKAGWKRIRCEGESSGTPREQDHSKGSDGQQARL